MPPLFNVDAEAMLDVAERAVAFFVGELGDEVTSATQLRNIMTRPFSDAESEKRRSMCYTGLVELVNLFLSDLRDDYTTVRDANERELLHADIVRAAPFASHEDDREAFASEVEALYDTILLSIIAPLRAAAREL